MLTKLFLIHLVREDIDVNEHAWRLLNFSFRYKLKKRNRTFIAFLYFGLQQ